jgi:hypothetical protein
LDSPDNGEGISILCDVYIPSLGDDLYQVPFSQEMSSVDNFIDYRPKGIKKRVAKKGEENPSNDLRLDSTKDDGDSVIVQFINGSVQQPIITGFCSSYHTRFKAPIVPYPRYGEAEGDHYRIRMNGMEIYIDKDGNLDIKSTKTYEKTEANKKITVKLFAEKDDFDVSEDQKQSIELVIDNTKDAPKITATVTDNTSDQKKQIIDIDGTAHTTKVTSQNVDGESFIELSPTGIAINTFKDITITATEKTTINIDGDVTATIGGKLTATVTGDAKIESSGNTTVKAATKAIVEAPAIELGEGATEAVIKGNTFQTLFNAHIHNSICGPTLPPVVLLSGTELSTVVKTK